MGVCRRLSRRPLILAATLGVGVVVGIGNLPGGAGHAGGIGVTES
jgi:hypothetical protein